MSSPMNTLLLGLTMYDTLLIVTSVMMVGVPSIHTHSSYVIDTQPHDRSEKSWLELQTNWRSFYNHEIFVSRSASEDEPVFNFYMSSIFPYITPVIYPVRASRVFTAAIMRCYLCVIFCSSSRYLLNRVEVLIIRNENIGLNNWSLICNHSFEVQGISLWVRMYSIHL